VCTVRAITFSFSDDLDLSTMSDVFFWSKPSGDYRSLSRYGFSLPWCICPIC